MSSGEPLPLSTRSAFSEAASGALAARGFTVLEGVGHARYTATIMLSRDQAGTTTVKVPAERSSFGGGGVGVGANITVPLPSTKRKLVPVQQTQLELRISERDRADPVWRGTAVAVRAAGTKDGSDPAVAADLIEAVLRIYPAQTDAVASVP
ncbi:hypothetical protein [Sphingomonas sp. ID0503]|uniref:hypothetical protein n=1 Tax=Sphingomonas sp. ID0503 TaxID=3399691 RepID=UPI003AFB6191